MRGHATIFETTVYMSIFCAGLQDTGGPWHLKKWCRKKNCAKVNFIPNGPFLKIQKENYFLHPPLNLFYIMLLHPIDIMLPHPIKYIFNYYITLTFSLTIYKNWSFISTGKFLFLLIIKLM